MSIPFSELPGRHERHYRRKIDNPLFGDASVTLDEQTLLEMQRLDHEELLAFLDALRQTVQSAVDLKPNVGSEVILQLKEQLDRLYEQSAGLADDHSANQSALSQLLEVIMRKVEAGATGDPQALDELAQERIARQAHFTLLKSPLVADLLHPQSAITADEFAPSLLSADESTLAAALELFDLEQLDALFDDAGRCLQACENPPPAAVDRVQQIGGRRVAMRQRTALN